MIDHGPARNDVGPIDDRLAIGEDGGVPTQIDLDFPRQKALTVREMPEEVKEAIGAVEPADVPLVELTDLAGQPVIVNAKHVGLIGVIR